MHGSILLIGNITVGPRLLAPVRLGNVLTVSLPTTRGRAYFLQSKNLLSDPNWTFISAIVGDGSVRTLTDPAPSGSCRFYRVRQQ